MFVGHGQIVVSGRVQFVKKCAHETLNALLTCERRTALLDGSESLGCHIIG